MIFLYCKIAFFTVIRTINDQIEHRLLTVSAADLAYGVFKLSRTVDAWIRPTLDLSLVGPIREFGQQASSSYLRWDIILMRRIQLVATRRGDVP